MDILSKSGNFLRPRPALGVPSHTSTPNHASLTASSVGRVRLGSAPDTASHRDILAQIALAAAATHAEARASVTATPAAGATHKRRWCEHNPDISPLGEEDISKVD
ncbi:MAG: hypothetical protein L0H94_06055 [Nitrospira sp.]|nr:hypothetical protein [Nitrospira sp.]